MNLQTNAKQKADVMSAFSEGKEVESRCANSLSIWKLDSFPSWNWEEYEYRIKAEEKWRPFKSSEEVPYGCILLKGKYDRVKFALVLWVQEDGFLLPSSQGVQLYTFKECFEAGDLMSLDNGKTWQPCGVKHT